MAYEGIPWEKQPPGIWARGHLHVLVSGMFQRAGVTWGCQSTWAGGKAGKKGSSRLQRL